MLLHSSTIKVAVHRIFVHRKWENRAREGKHCQGLPCAGAWMWPASHDVTEPWVTTGREVIGQPRGVASVNVENRRHA